MPHDIILIIFVHYAPFSFILLFYLVKIGSDFLKSIWAHVSSFFMPNLASISNAGCILLRHFNKLIPSSLERDTL